MIVKEKTMQEKEVVKDVLCDICGKGTKKSDGFDEFEYAVLTAAWGYQSRKDGESWECVLCEDCADEFKNWVEKMKGGKIIIKNCF
jgi:hypothetical protein